MLIVNCLLLFSSLTADKQATQRAIELQVRVEVRRDRSGWLATYRLPPGHNWLFAHSARARATEQPWRPRSWTVVTPGVRIARAGEYDVLTGSSGSTPSVVRIRFEPFAQSVIADNDPALQLSDGTVALFTDQFDVLPAAKLASVSAAGDDIDRATIGSARTAVTFRNRLGNVLLSGRAQPKVETANAETYAVFVNGRRPLDVRANAFVDPALPSWIRAEVQPLLLSTIDDYSARLGPLRATSPVLVAQWTGPTPRTSGMGGSVVKDVVVMNFEGDGLLVENQQVRDRARLFVAHEAVHFWLGQQTRVAERRHRWITEGGAELMATRTIAGRDASFTPSLRLNALVKECSALLAGGSLSAIADQGNDRVHYACGTVLALVAEGASGGEFDRFLKDIMKIADRDEGVLTPGDWTGHLRGSGKVQLAERVEELLTKRLSSPADYIDRLLADAGVARDVRVSADTK